MGAQMIVVVQELEELSKLGLENCCLCEKPTAFWYEPKDVACCPTCAETATHESLPSKKEWCDREAKEKR